MPTQTGEQINATASGDFRSSWYCKHFRVLAMSCRAAGGDHCITLCADLAAALPPSSNVTASGHDMVQ
eukprot:5950136-Amphidinium_carterae.1